MVTERDKETSGGPKNKQVHRYSVAYRVCSINMLAFGGLGASLGLCLVKNSTKNTHF
jgi:hypothetical protein